MNMNVQHAMSGSARAPRQGLRVAATAAAVASLGVLAMSASAQEPASEWTYTVETLATGVNNGYQLALDPVNRRVYFSDARWRTEDRAEDGTITVRQTGTGKLVVFDSETRDLVEIHSFLDLTRNDGNGREGEPFDWTGVDANSITSQRTTFSPYGVAVDGRATNADGEIDPIIVTTTARGRDLSPEYGYGGNVVVYHASQGAPTDADRVFQFEDGEPIFDGIRRIAINTQTHKAYITNMGTSRGGQTPGGIVVIDLPTKQVDARITVPGGFGAIGVAVDEENNLVYVGSMTGEKLYVIDAGAVDTSDPQSYTLNDDAITELDAVVGVNARPTYSPELQRVYVSAYASPVGIITVVDANPDSETYGQAIDTIETGPTNAVEVDAERGLLYSANLGAREVVVFDTENHEVVLRLPTTGNALNIGIDPVTRDVWVSNFAATSFVNIFRVQQAQ